MIINDHLLIKLHVLIHNAILKMRLSPSMVDATVANHCILVQLTKKDALRLIVDLMKYYHLMELAKNVLHTWYHLLEIIHVSNLNAC